MEKTAVFIFFVIHAASWKNSAFHMQCIVQIAFTSRAGNILEDLAFSMGSLIRYMLLNSLVYMSCVHS